MNKEDHTFSETREKSVMQWLDDLKAHDDIVVRDGVRVTMDYIASLNKKVEQLEESNALKDRFLKKLKQEKMELMEK